MRRIRSPAIVVTATFTLGTAVTSSSSVTRPMMLPALPESPKLMFAVVAPALTVTRLPDVRQSRSEEHTSELQSRPHLVCRLLLEKKKTTRYTATYAQLYASRVRVPR